MNKEEHIIVVDIGNSYVKIGVFSKNSDKCLKLVLFKTSKKTTQNSLKIILSKFKKFNIKFSIIGSVVFNLYKVYEKVILSLFGVKSYLISKKTKFSFSISEEARKEIGDDLLALCEYCVSKDKEVFGISFGTAIALIYLSNNELKGVSIAVGLGIGMEKLISNASLLKNAKIDKFKNVFYGTNTINALESGINNIRRGFILSILEKFKSENFYDPLFVITGGESFGLDIPNLKYELNKESILIGFKKIYFLNNK